LARLHHIAILKPRCDSPTQRAQRLAQLALGGAPPRPRARRPSQTALAGGVTVDFTVAAHCVCPAEVSAVLVASRPWARARLPPYNLSSVVAAARRSYPFLCVQVQHALNTAHLRPASFWLCAAARRPPVPIPPSNSTSSTASHFLAAPHGNGRLTSTNETVVRNRNARSLRPK
jgi:hypothetical protein